MVLDSLPTPDREYGRDSKYSIILILFILLING